MSILEFFDITNKEHLLAYNHLRNKRKWPENFLPDGIKFPTLWRSTLEDMIVTAYIESTIAKREEKAPIKIKVLA